MNIHKRDTFYLSLSLHHGLHDIVNQQIRFVLGDQHWDELKKLTTIGTA